MHPVQVDNYNIKILEEFRETKRKIRIFFSGSWTQNQYKVPLEKFNVLTRFEVISHVINIFYGDGIVKSITETKELYEFLNSNNSKEKIIISDVKTADEDWLKFLSCSDFFIAPTGFKYPWSHNSIEAMSVGTIPILQCNKLFMPHLLHMENCIVYKNTTELEDAIKIALNISLEDLKIMRQNVISYYENYLSPEIISEKLKSIVESEEKELSIAIPYIN